MSKFNLLFFLNAYKDAASTNQPNFQNFKWSREINGLSASKPLSQELSLAPGESKTVFDGTRALSQDGSTVYSLALKVGASSIYVLKHISGTAPAFRTARSSAADATTQITVTQNGPLLIFTSTGGTALSLIAGGAVVGDYVRLGSLFDVNNQGEWKILALTATSLTVKNDIGVAQGPITLAAGFDDQLRVYGALGVQVDDTLNITGGFSIISRDAYKITAVSDNLVEFSSLEVLPTEASVTTNALAIYSAAKQFVYLETSEKVSLIINGIATGDVEPFLVGNKPGIFVKTATMWSLAITNQSTDPASVYVAAIE